jgi:hypothetical protein
VSVRESAFLTTDVLDGMPDGALVRAGGFEDRDRHTRRLWRKLPSGRWQLADGGAVFVGGKPGVSSGWLAGNRRPERAA